MTQVTLGSTETIFGSPARAKVLRFFALQPEGRWASQEELSLRLRMPRVETRKELTTLLQLGILRSRRVGVAKPKSRARRKRSKSRRPKRKTIEVFFLNESFPALKELKTLARYALPPLASRSFRSIRSAGRIRLLLFSGAFVGDTLLPVDILIVGEGVRRKAVERALTSLEHETGLDLRYAIFSTEEFTERRTLHDRFLRDILESLYVCLINTLMKEEESPKKEKLETGRLPLGV